MSTKGNKVRVGSSATSNHLGPAVNKKPTKKSGIKPSDISIACAVPGARFQVICRSVVRASNITVHHNAMIAIITAPLKKAKRCGAASNKPHRQVISVGGGGFLGVMRSGLSPVDSGGVCRGLSAILSATACTHRASEPPNNHSRHRQPSWSLQSQPLHRRWSRGLAP